MIGQGDYLAMQVIYTQGALRYLYQNPGTGNMYLQDNQSTTFGIMSDGVYGGNIFTGNATRHPADNRLGRQRRLRALLEPAVENVSLRRLRSDELQLASQCPALCQLMVRAPAWRAFRSGKRWLQQQLEPVVDRFPYSVERDEGLLHGSRRCVREVRQRHVARWCNRRYRQHRPE